MIRWLSHVLLFGVIGFAVGVYSGKAYQLRTDQWEFTSHSVTHGLKGDKLVLSR